MSNIYDEEQGAQHTQTSNGINGDVHPLTTNMHVPASTRVQGAAVAAPTQKQTNTQINPQKTKHNSPNNEEKKKDQ